MPVPRRHLDAGSKMAPSVAEPSRGVPARLRAHVLGRESWGGAPPSLRPAPGAAPPRTSLRPQPRSAFLPPREPGSGGGAAAAERANAGGSVPGSRGWGRGAGRGVLGVLAWTGRGRPWPRPSCRGSTRSWLRSTRRYPSWAGSKGSLALWPRVALAASYLSGRWRVC